MKDGIMLQSQDKPLLVLDFDGVLHSYTSGWVGTDNVTDPPVPGAQDFCSRALEEFDVLVVSSRCSQSGGTQAILDWLHKWNFPSGMYVSLSGIKPPAKVTIDDRAITFAGEWPEIKDLQEFKPWNRRT